MASALQRGQEGWYIRELGVNDVWFPSWYQSNRTFRLASLGSTMWTTTGSSVLAYRADPASAEI